MILLSIMVLVDREERTNNLSYWISIFFFTCNFVTRRYSNGLCISLEQQILSVTLNILLLVVSFHLSGHDNIKQVKEVDISYDTYY